MDDPLSPHACQNATLRDRLISKEHDMSCADLTSELVPTTSRLRHKQQSERKGIENEELIKYMSNLPNYLERGEKCPEKALNVGVLNWRHLEKWQYNNKHNSCKSGKCSPSSSNSSSFFSTDGSSTRSSRGQSCSPTRQRMHRATLQSHLIASPVEGCLQVVKSSVKNAGNFEDITAASINQSEEESFVRSGLALNRNSLEIKSQGCRTNNLDLSGIPELKLSQNIKDHGVVTCSKGKKKVEDVESTGQNKFQDSFHSVTGQDFTERHKTFICLPRECPDSIHSRVAGPSDLRYANGHISHTASRRSFSEGSKLNEVYPTELISDSAHSDLLACETNGSPAKKQSFTDAMSNKDSSKSSQRSPSPRTLSVSPSRNQIVKEKKPSIMPNLTPKPFNISDLKTKDDVASRLRNASPTRRFSIGMGKVSKNPSLKDSAARPAAKSGSERVEVSCCSDSLIGDKQSPSIRARSSPLRRLLDPLLKPKTSNYHESAGPSRNDSDKGTDRVCKSLNGRGESSSLNSMKLKLDLSSCRTIDIDDSQQMEKSGLSTVQALLQVAAKNGLPLFTFAVNKNSGILAATVRDANCSTKDENSIKDENRWIYTFFTVREVKKKNGSWLNQHGRGKGHDYVPNVVAQMKVSNLGRHLKDQFNIREFVLSSMDLKQTDQQMADMQPNELAAIVVKFPGNATKDFYQGGPGFGLKNSSPDVGKFVNPKHDEETRSSVGSHDLFSATVILPGGVHGLPSKGEPSPLIERWKSGGSCDCGGWDVGCRLRVFANETQPDGSQNSQKTHGTANRFELFTQGEAVGKKPVFSISSLKDGIFSVDFNPSLSILQAFSICIAILNSRKASELSELKNIEEAKLPDSGVLKELNRIQAENSTRFASYPPSSPVGRV